MTIAAIILTVLLVVMQAFDLYSTYYSMTHGGRETNPVMLTLRDWIISLPYGGPWLWLVIAKSAGLIALAVGWYFDAWATPFGIAGLIAMCALYAFYLRGNLDAIRK